MIAVTTRFQLKSLWRLLPFLMSYWRMRADIANSPGLLRHALLMENPCVWVALSVWASDEAMSDFANTRSHIDAQRGARVCCRAIWSAYWRLDALSKHARDWPGSAEWPETIPHSWHPNRVVQPSKRSIHTTEAALENQ